MLDFLSTLFRSLSPLWEMSVTAAYAAAIVIVLRLLLKKRAPKQVLCLLWLVVFARLLIPVSLESPLSIVPSALPGQEQQIQTVPSIPNAGSTGNAVNPITPQTPAQGVTQNQPAQSTVTPTINTPNTSPVLTVPEGVTPAPAPVFPAPVLWQVVIAGVWLAGVVLMTAYALFAYLRLRRCLFDAIRAKDGAWEHPAVNSPFILGLVRPKIYLPAGLAGQPRKFILCHERAHLRRFDHVVKPICWVALALHWFNPLVWAAYILMSRDIEAACDEAVIRRLGPQVKADYSATLLALATNGRVPAPCPLAFDEGDAKGRIKNVLRYRSPALWIVVVSVIAAVLAAVCLLTDPVAAKGTDPEPDPDPDASASQEPANLSDTVLDPWMKEILDGERTFTSGQEEFNIHQLRTMVYGDEELPKLTLEVGRLAAIDLDKDGINEMVVWPVDTLGERDDPTEIGYYVGYFIFRRQGDDVKVYYEGWRPVQNLKADGTFQWSSSAFNSGTASMTFDGDQIVSHYITWQDYDQAAEENVYFVNGLSATREEFGAAYDAQVAKDEPIWYTYADGVLVPWLPDNLELAAQTGEQDAGEAKLWLEGEHTPWLEWNGSAAKLGGAFTLVQSPRIYCRDFDGDGENEVVVSYDFNGFLELDLYEWQSNRPVLAAAYHTEQLLLGFNQNNVAGYNKDSRGLTVTYTHTEGDPDSPDYYRHLVTGSCTLPEGFFDGGYEHIRDGYTYAYADQFHLFYLNNETNEFYFDFEFYLADETMQELNYVPAHSAEPSSSWYADHYMLGKPVGVTGFTLRYDGTQWKVQEADALNMDYQEANTIPLDDEARTVSVPDFLDAEQQTVYRQAYTMYCHTFGANSEMVDFWPQVNKYGSANLLYGDYTPATGLYANWNDFKDAVLSVFTERFWTEQNGQDPPTYVNIDGTLHYLAWARGSGGYNENFPETFRLEEKTDNTISFVMTGYYSELRNLVDENDVQRDARLSAYWENSIEFPMRMVRTENGWRFDEFHCARTDNGLLEFSSKAVPNPNLALAGQITDLAPLSAPLVPDYSSQYIPSDPEEWYKVAELPDDMIWLYTRNYGDSQTLIRWDGNFYRVFNHRAHTPHCVMPEMKKLGGADTYGPLAVISHVDSGTGVDEYELVVYDLDAANPADYTHDWTALAEDFNQNHTFRFDNDTRVMTLTYQGQTVTKTLTYELIGDHDRIEREGCSLYITGEMVHYSYDETSNGNFQIRLGAKFLIGDSWAVLLFPVEVTWTLRFNGSGFDVVPGSCVVA